MRNALTIVRKKSELQDKNTTARKVTIAIKSESRDKNLKLQKEKSELQEIHSIPRKNSEL